MSASRSKVASSSTVGKIAKSSGLDTWNTASMISSDNAILKVNNTSSASGGSGSTTIDRIANKPMGTPMPRVSDFNQPTPATGASAAVPIAALLTTTPRHASLVVRYSGQSLAAQAIQRRYFAQS